MTAQRGIFILPDGSSNGTTPLNARLALAGLLSGTGASALGIQSGVFADGQGLVVTGNSDTGTMSYSVRAAAFALPLLGTAASGAVVAVNDATFKATTTAAPGSNSRIDVIWVRQHAVASDGGADTDNVFQIGVTQGTAAASPAVPAIPTGAMALAQAVVPTGTTSTLALAITQVHGWTVAKGAAIPVRSQAERDALTGYDGLTVDRLDLNAKERHDGTNWLREAAHLPAANLTHKPRRILVNTSLAFAALSANTEGSLGGWVADTGDDGATSGITVASNGLITVTKGGLYRISPGTVFAAAASGAGALKMWLTPTINGSLVVTAGTTVRFINDGLNSSLTKSFNAEWEVVLADGATFCIGVRQSSGGSLGVGSTSAGGAWLSIVRDDD